MVNLERLIVKPYWIDQSGEKQYMKEADGTVETTVPAYWSFLMPISRTLGFNTSSSDETTALVFSISMSAN